MKRNRALSRLSLVLLAGLLALVPPADAQKRGGTYRAVLGADPPTLDPAQATDTTSSAVLRQIFDGLVELDETMQPVASIAEKWSVSHDQRVYTFTLRRGVRFQNGREVKAADFHTRNIGPPGNSSRFSNPEVDKLFDEADRMPAGPARLAKYREAEKVIVEEAPWVFVYWYTSRLLQKPSVKGLERSPMSNAPEMHMAPLRKVWLDR